MDKGAKIRRKETGKTRPSGTFFGKKTAPESAFFRPPRLSSDPFFSIRRLVLPPTSPPSFTGATTSTAAPRYQLPSTQSGSLSRAEFDRIMQQNFGVGQIANGSLTDQEQELRNMSGNATLSFNPPGWQAWDPGSSSSLYAYIINGFRDFAQTFGSIPEVRKIIFFPVNYTYDHATRSVVRQANVPAAFGGGTLSIFRLITLASKPLPAGRSQSGSPSSAVHPGREESVRRIITHELGHGVVETALTPRAGGAAPDPQFMNDYMRVAGWSSSPTALYDAGVPAVRQALATGNTPDARYRITSSNWNDPQWIEQPISSYMTTSPAEDLPEAVMTYIRAPDILRSRSPRRYQFIHSRVSLLIPYMRRIAPQPPPKGDFPLPQSDIRMV